MAAIPISIKNNKILARVAEVRLFFFDTVGKVCETTKILGPDEDMENILGDAFAYTPKFEVWGEIDIILPDEKMSEVKMPPVVYVGKKVYRSGMIIGCGDIPHVQPASARSVLIGKLTEWNCKFLILVPDSNSKKHIYPFYPEKDICEVSIPDIEVCD
ncbi:MAG: hypothetical protein HY617_01535 [Candidatus Sungbacteria bacterium]|nr:hypothetical protein [Candidatus Sungbacteria bacterium]